MRVRITRTLHGEVDGIDLARFVEGLTYDVGTTLGSYLLAQGWARPAGRHEPQTIPAFNRTLRSPGILVVEDDEDLRAIMTQLLEYRGWDTCTARDGVEGLQALQKHRPALILLDLAMPRMDGVQFREAQRGLQDRRLASTPCVVVSALPDAPDYQAKLSAADVLVKPFEPDRLVAAVETHARPLGLFHP